MRLQFRHHFFPADKVDEGDVGDAEQQAAQHTEEGAEARIITDDLGHAEKSGLERGCAGGDECSFSACHYLVGLVVDYLNVNSLGNVLPVNIYVYVGGSG